MAKEEHPINSNWEKMRKKCFEGYWGKNMREGNVFGIRKTRTEILFHLALFFYGRIAGLKPSQIHNF